MKFEDFVSIIYKNLAARFEIDATTDSKSLESLAPTDLIDKKLLRIYRSPVSIEGSGYRKTLLIARIDESKQLENALEWAASMRDFLLDPENADLYLFLCWGDQNPQSLEDCLRIESTEEFCRKYIVRPNETEQSFIERTFLSKIDNALEKRLETDPVVKIFGEIKDEYPWFNDEEQKKWRDAFNSELSGVELIELLFSHKEDLL